MVLIFAFGDSIAYGNWDSNGGWVQRIRSELDKKALDEDDFYSLTYNLGVSGQTTKDLLKRFESEIGVRVKESHENIIIFSIGSNDVSIISEEDFKVNLENLIGMSKSYSSKIAFLEILPRNDKSNDEIVQYNNILRNVCSVSDVYFIDLYETFLENIDNLLERDDIHPNSSGHDIIADKVKQVFHTIFAYRY